MRVEHFEDFIVMAVSKRDKEEPGKPRMMEKKRERRYLGAVLIDQDLTQG